jgi:hypothetical protein
MAMCELHTLPRVFFIYIIYGEIRRYFGLVLYSDTKVILGTSRGILFVFLYMYLFIYLVFAKYHNKYKKE